MSNVKNNFDQNSNGLFHVLVAVAIYKPKLGWVRLACAHSKSVESARDGLILLGLARPPRRIERTLT